MIPLLVILGAMIVGFVAPQLAKKEAMKGVFLPPKEIIAPIIIKPIKSPLEGRV